MRPPTKKDREICWAARDEYFKCLDENNQWLNGFAPTTHQEKLDAVKQNAPTPCQELRNFYVKHCPLSWVSHFEQLRLEELQKNYLVDQMAKKETGDEFWQRVGKK